MASFNSKKYIIPAGTLCLLLLASCGKFKPELVPAGKFPPVFYKLPSNEQEKIKSLLSEVEEEEEEAAILEKISQAHTTENLSQIITEIQKKKSQRDLPTSGKITSTSTIKGSSLDNNNVTTEKKGSVPAGKEHVTSTKATHPLAKSDQFWGKKLPLQGDKRTRFILAVNGYFKITEKKNLRELFSKVNRKNIINFLNAFFKFGDQPIPNNSKQITEQQKLLCAIIYLYQQWPSLTLTLCNEPEKLSYIDKIGLLNKAGPEQCVLLKKLESYL